MFFFVAVNTRLVTASFSSQHCFRSDVFSSGSSNIPTYSSTMGWRGWREVGDQLLITSVCILAPGGSVAAYLPAVDPDNLIWLGKFSLFGAMEKHGSAFDIWHAQRACAKVMIM